MQIHTLIKLLDRIVSRASFLSGNVFECDITHCSSSICGSIMYVIYSKIRRNPMHPLCGALPVPYVPVRVTHGALVAHRYNAPPSSRTSQTTVPHNFYSPLNYLENELVDPVFDGVRLAGFKSWAIFSLTNL